MKDTEISGNLSKFQKLTSKYKTKKNKVETGRTHSLSRSEVKNRDNFRAYESDNEITYERDGSDERSFRHDKLDLEHTQERYSGPSGRLQLRLKRVKKTDGGTDTCHENSSKRNCKLVANGSRQTGSSDYVCMYNGSDGDDEKERQKLSILIKKYRTSDLSLELPPEQRVRPSIRSRLKNETGADKTGDFNKSDSQSKDYEKSKHEKNGLNIKNDDKSDDIVKFVAVKSSVNAKNMCGHRKNKRKEIEHRGRSSKLENTRKLRNKSVSESESEFEVEEKQELRKKFRKVRSKCSTAGKKTEEDETGELDKSKITDGQDKTNPKISENETRNFKCLFCKKVFVSDDFLDNHYMTHFKTVKGLNFFLNQRRQLKCSLKPPVNSSSILKQSGRSHSNVKKKVAFEMDVDEGVDCRSPEQNNCEIIDLLSDGDNAFESGSELKGELFEVKEEEETGMSMNLKPQVVTSDDSGSTRGNETEKLSISVDGKTVYCTYNTEIAKSCLQNNARIVISPLKFLNEKSFGKIETKKNLRDHKTDVMNGHWSVAQNSIKKNEMTKSTNTRNKTKSSKNQEKGALKLKLSKVVENGRENVHNARKKSSNEDEKLDVSDLISEKCVTVEMSRIAQINNTQKANTESSGCDLESSICKFDKDRSFDRVPYKNSKYVRKARSRSFDKNRSFDRVTYKNSKYMRKARSRSVENGSKRRVLNIDIIKKDLIGWTKEFVKMKTLTENIANSKLLDQNVGVSISQEISKVSDTVMKDASKKRSKKYKMTEKEKDLSVHSADVQYFLAKDSDSVKVDGDVPQEMQTFNQKQLCEEIEGDPSKYLQTVSVGKHGKKTAVQRKTKKNDGRHSDKRYFAIDCKSSSGGNVEKIDVVKKVKEGNATTKSDNNLTGEKRKNVEAKKKAKRTVRSVKDSCKLIGTSKKKKTVLSKELVSSSEDSGIEDKQIVETHFTTSNEKKKNGTTLTGSSKNLENKKDEVDGCVERLEENNSFAASDKQTNLQDSENFSCCKKANNKEVKGDVKRRYEVQRNLEKIQLYIVSEENYFAKKEMENSSKEVCCNASRRSKAQTVTNENKHDKSIHQKNRRNEQTDLLHKNRISDVLKIGSEISSDKFVQNEALMLERLNDNDTKIYDSCYDEILIEFAADVDIVLNSPDKAALMFDESALYRNLENASDKDYLKSTDVTHSIENSKASNCESNESISGFAAVERKNLESQSGDRDADVNNSTQILEKTEKTPESSKEPMNTDPDDLPVCITQTVLFPKVDKDGKGSSESDSHFELFNQKCKWGMESSLKMKDKGGNNCSDKFGIDKQVYDITIAEKKKETRGVGKPVIDFNPGNDKSSEIGSQLILKEKEEEIQTTANSAGTLQNHSVGKAHHELMISKKFNDKGTGTQQKLNDIEKQNEMDKILVDRQSSLNSELKRNYPDTHLRNDLTLGDDTLYAHKKEVEHELQVGSRGEIYNGFQTKQFEKLEGNSHLGKLDDNSLSGKTDVMVEEHDESRHVDTEDSDLTHKRRKHKHNHSVHSGQKHKHRKIEPRENENNNTAETVQIIKPAETMETYLSYSDKQEELNKMVKQDMPQVKSKTDLVTLKKFYRCDKCNKLFHALANLDLNSCIKCDDKLNEKTFGLKDEKDLEAHKMKNKKESTKQEGEIQQKVDIVNIKADTKPVSDTANESVVLDPTIEYQDDCFEVTENPACKEFQSPETSNGQKRLKLVLQKMELSSFRSAEYKCKFTGSPELPRWKVKTFETNKTPEKYSFNNSDDGSDKVKHFGAEDRLKLPDSEQINSVNKQKVEECADESLEFSTRKGTEILKPFTGRKAEKVENRIDGKPQNLENGVKKGSTFKMKSKEKEMNPIKKKNQSAEVLNEFEKALLKEHEITRKEKNKKKDAMKSKRKREECQTGEKLFAVDNKALLFRGRSCSRSFTCNESAHFQKSKTAQMIYNKHHKKNVDDGLPDFSAAKVALGNLPPLSVSTKSLSVAESMNKSSGFLYFKEELSLSESSSDSAASVSSKTAFPEVADLSSSSVIGKEAVIPERKVSLPEVNTSAKQDFAIKQKSEKTLIGFKNATRKEICNKADVLDLKDLKKELEAVVINKNSVRLKDLMKSFTPGSAFCPPWSKEKSDDSFNNSTPVLPSFSETFSKKNPLSADQNQTFPSFTSCDKGPGYRDLARTESAYTDDETVFAELSEGGMDEKRELEQHSYGSVFERLGKRKLSEESTSTIFALQDQISSPFKMDEISTPCSPKITESSAAKHIEQKRRDFSSTPAVKLSFRNAISEIQRPALDISHISRCSSVTDTSNKPKPKRRKIKRLEIPECDSSTGTIHENSSVADELQNNSIADRPENNSVAYVLKNNNVADIRENKIISDIPKNISMAEILENNSMADIPENNSMVDILENNSVADIPENNSVADIPENISITDIPENNSVADIFENNSMADILENKSVTNILENKHNLQDSQMQSLIILSAECSKMDMTKLLGSTIEKSVEKSRTESFKQATLHENILSANVDRNRALGKLDRNVSPATIELPECLLGDSKAEDALDHLELSSFDELLSHMSNDQTFSEEKVGEFSSYNPSIANISEDKNSDLEENSTDEIENEEDMYEHSIDPVPESQRVTEESEVYSDSENSEKDENGHEEAVEVDDFDKSADDSHRDLTEEEVIEDVLQLYASDDEASFLLDSAESSPLVPLPVRQDKARVLDENCEVVDMDLATISSSGSPVRVADVPVNVLSSGWPDQITKQQHEVPVFQPMRSNPLKTRWMPHGWCFRYFSRKPCSVQCTFRHDNPTEDDLKRFLPDIVEKCKKGELNSGMNMLDSHGYFMKNICEDDLDCLYGHSVNHLNMEYCHKLLQLIATRNLVKQGHIDDLIYLWKRLVYCEDITPLKDTFYIAKEKNIYPKPQAVLTLLEAFAAYSDVYILWDVIAYCTQEKDFVVPQQFINKAVTLLITCRDRLLLSTAVAWLGNVSSEQLSNIDDELLSTLGSKLQQENLIAIASSVRQCLQNKRQIVSETGQQTIPQSNLANLNLRTENSALVTGQNGVNQCSNVHLQSRPVTPTSSDLSDFGRTNEQRKNQVSMQPRTVTPVKRDSVDLSKQRAPQLLTSQLKSRNPTKQDTNIPIENGYNKRRKPLLKTPSRVVTPTDFSDLVSRVSRDSKKHSVSEQNILKKIKTAADAGRWEDLADLFLQCCQYGLIQAEVFEQMLLALTKDDSRIGNVWRKFIQHIQQKQTEDPDLRLDRYSLSVLGSEIFYFCSRMNLFDAKDVLLVILDTDFLELSQFVSHRWNVCLELEAAEFLCQVRIPEKAAEIALEFSSKSLASPDVKTRLWNLLLPLTEQLCVEKNYPMAFQIFCMAFMWKYRGLRRIASDLIESCLHVKLVDIPIQVYELYVTDNRKFDIRDTVKRSLLNALVETKIEDGKRLFLEMKQNSEADLFLKQSLKKPRCIWIQSFLTRNEIKLIIEQYLNELYSLFCDQIAEKITLTSQDLSLSLALNKLTAQVTTEGVPYVGVAKASPSLIRLILLNKFGIQSELTCQGSMKVTVFPESLEQYMTNLDVKGRNVGLEFSRDNTTQSVKRLKVKR